jgi:hypothetical protein
VNAGTTFEGVKPSVSVPDGICGGSRIGMKKPILFLLISASSFAQTTVYVRASAPPVIQVCNVTNPASSGTAPRVTTCLPNSSGARTTAAHGFPAGCGSTQTCYVELDGVVTDGAGQGGAMGTCPSYGSTAVGATASYANGIRAIDYIDATHVDLYDLTGVSSSVHLGNPLPSTGNWCWGQYGGAQAPIQWIGLLTAYTMGAGPWGYLDGQFGPTTSRLYLNATDGLSSVSLTGCPSACVITIALSGTTYNPLTAHTPTAAGNNFSVGGTGTNLDSTVSTSCAGSGTAPLPVAYTIAAVSSTGWTSTPFACSISNGTYAGASTCGPPATPNDTGPNTGGLPCTWVSQLAYAGNPAWASLASVRAANYFDQATSNSDYKYVMDGGLNNPGTPFSEVANAVGAAAIAFMVDWGNANLFDVTQYYFRQNWMPGGVSFPLNEANGGGNSDLAQAGVYAASESEAMVFSAYQPYAATATLNAHLNTRNNDLDYPVNQCSKQGAEISSSSNINYVVNSGISQGAPTSATLTLPSGASGIVAGEVIVFNTSSGIANAGPLINVGAFGTITSFTGGGGSAPQVTVSGGFYTGDIGGLPGTAVQYAIYAGATWSTTTAGSSATVTMIPSSLTPSSLSIAVGDAVSGTNTWSDCSAGGLCQLVALQECRVTSIAGGGLASNQFKCTNSSGVRSGLTSTAGMLWHFPMISVSTSSITSSTGQCGFRWSDKHSVPWMPTASALYGGAGLQLGGESDATNTIPFYSNQQPGVMLGHLAYDLATAPYDARSVRNLAADSFVWDTGYQHWASYSANGAVHLGPQYSTWPITTIAEDIWLLSRNLIGFAATVNTTGAWIDPALFWQYTLLPDFDSNPCGESYCGQPICWDGACSNSQLNQGTTNAEEFLRDSGFYFAPNAATTSYLKNWLKTVLGGGQDLTAAYGNVDPHIPVLYVDPSSGGGASGTDYRNQPLQQLFSGNSQAAIASGTGCNSGWVTGYNSPVCPPGVAGTIMVSRTTWANYGQTGNYCGTVFFDRDAGFSGGHGDNAGTLTKAYKCGVLFGTDYVDGGGQDLSWLGPAMRFGDSTNANGSGYQFNWISGNPPLLAAPTTLLRWTSANHGSWAANYGDQSSSVAHVCLDSVGRYVSARGVTSATRCSTHFKASGLSEWILEGDEAFGSSQSMQRAIHYPQAYSQTSGLPDAPYHNGTTGCLNSSGSSVSCSSITTANRIQSLECTGTGCPSVQSGVLTQIYSPNTITLHWDGSTYSGSNHGSDRLTIAGGASVGASVTAFETIVIHAIGTASAIGTREFTVNSNWWGVEGCTSVSCFGYLQARNNCTAGGCTVSVPTFTTSQSSSLPYQYLISGVPAGTYNVSVASVGVVSNYTVSAGDNTIAFTLSSGTTSGAVAVTAASGGVAASGVPTSVSGGTNVTGSVPVIH